MMIRINRKVLRTALVGMCGVAAAVPMIVSGTAEAQTGSRLCGRFWRSPDTGEVLTRIYETPKSDKAVCGRASSNETSPGVPIAPKDSPFKDILRDKTSPPAELNIGPVDPLEDWQHVGFRMVECEHWAGRPLSEGGLGPRPTSENPGGLPIEFQGDGWPEGVDQFNLCNNMDRSDNLFSMERYWLYWAGDKPDPTADKDKTPEQINGLLDWLKQQPLRFKNA